MRGDNHAVGLTRRREQESRTLVEGALGSGFRMGQVWVGGEQKSGLDLGSVEQLRVFASHNEAEPSKILDDSSIAVLAIQAHERLSKGNVLGPQVSLDHFQRTAQFTPVVTVARSPKRG